MKTKIRNIFYFRFNGYMKGNLHDNESIRIQSSWAITISASIFVHGVAREMPTMRILSISRFRFQRFWRVNKCEMKIYMCANKYCMNKSIRLYITKTERFIYECLLNFPFIFSFQSRLFSIARIIFRSSIFIFFSNTLQEVAHIRERHKFLW